MKRLHALLHPLGAFILLLATGAAALADDRVRVFATPAATWEVPAETFIAYHKPIPEPPASLRGATDALCLAVAIYHEARGERPEGQRAVASVILQRARVPDRWGSTICDVVRPVQFSFMRAGGRFAPIHEMEAWKAAVQVARYMIAHGPLPELEGADHYHTTGVNPGWNRSMRLVTRIGVHKFWKDPRTGGQNV